MMIDSERYQLLCNVDPSLLGFGMPGVAALTVVADGLVDIEMVGPYWFARLTARGRSLRGAVAACSCDGVGLCCFAGLDAH